MSAAFSKRRLGLGTSVTLALGVALVPALASADAGAELGIRNLSSVIATPASPSAVGPTCTQNVTITSLANHDLVSTELGYAGNEYAMLRARATVEGPWEQYRICNFPSDGYWTIQSEADGLFVSAELGYTGDQYAMLRARASVVGPWEKFTLVPCGLSCTSIQSLANGLFVSAELGYTGGQYGMLRARASVVGPWEQFR
ncbi:MULTISPECIES: fascin domain-containing protein [Burkholderia]|uniref:Secreted protein n=1 Tax=Burkholderia mayonis TaxID=1385591 RepID=A0A1B4FTB1_9BURK|nr:MULTISPECIES: hypothetical protein [Burkholderia]AOJ06891.1 hypothetical protein WS71_05855 [Burkholderia mayonis]